MDLVAPLSSQKLIKERVRRLKVLVLWPPERQPKSSEHDISTSLAFPTKIQSLTLDLMHWLKSKDRKRRNVPGLNINSIRCVPKKPYDYSSFTNKCLFMDILISN
ncbi:hypothetical protein SADUNF_Sadunf18G0026800 [Salix dunnii]|uniref:Uncharacterized protein n=1 Tax=Salix dunnii TaxID=1413687 RepID=A0A835MLV1_9ROSI|nr:hypothetical protein SADUNF_Sadunf18G0026800 [Salix dunnii]